MLEVVYQNAPSRQYFGGSLVVPPGADAEASGNAFAALMLTDGSSTGALMSAETARTAASNLLPVLLSLDPDMMDQALEALIMEQVRTACMHTCSWLAPSPPP